MAREISCPACGEAEAIRGVRRGDLIELTCDRCSHQWERDPRPRCGKCGSLDVRPVPKAVMEKGRGLQRSIVGTITVHLCPVCDQQAWEKHRSSRAPLPPD